MPGKKNNEKTKNKIKDAFLTLYEHNNIEKISIRQLTDLAGVNRATFYSHYVDIYDLLEQLEDEKYNIFYEKLSTVVPIVMKGNTFVEYLPDMDFFKENEKWIRILVATYGKSNILERVKKNLKIIICKNLNIPESDVTPELGYALEYLISANASTFSSWIRNGMDIDIEGLKNIMATSMLKGPVTTILGLIHE